jgi:hypothetical protein
VKQRQHFIWQNSCWSIRILKDRPDKRARPSSIESLIGATCVFCCCFANGASFVIAFDYDCSHEDTFSLSRAVCMESAGNKYPMLLELTALNQEDPDRFDARRIHFVRLTGWPNYVQEAMNVPGRANCNRGVWEAMVSGGRT